MSKVCTTCPYCGVGCGVLATVVDGDVSVKGDLDHPANYGRLCSKGLTLAETLQDEDRLLRPHMNGQDVSWDSALSKVAKTFSDIISEHGPEAVAFYVSGQLLTEDYYVANKLMKGYIGSGNIDTNSRLCMASSVAGHVRAFGSDTVPGCYEDLELADLIILTGSNLAWCHPVLFQRIQAAKDLRPDLKIITIDPRRTASADLTDMHLALKPGSDVALFQGLLNYLSEAGVRDREFVTKHTNDVDLALQSASLYDLPTTAKLTGLTETELAQFFEAVARTVKTVTVYSQGVNQAKDGADRVNAILNTHLLTGRIGKPGCGPFSVTGQPNAMGGREVGGLANQLASHIGWDKTELVKTYWNSPTIATQPGLKAVDMFEAIHAGQIKAVWVMATNPVVSMPDANRVKEALARCELVVVSDIYAHTDTAKCADVLLPSTGWGEKDGTVTNSERRISRQRAFLPAPGEAKHDWWQFCEAAKRMGFNGFDFAGPDEIFKEYAGLSAVKNNGSRDLDLSDRMHLDKAKYDALQPFLWPLGRKRLFADGQFFTADKKANFVPSANDSALIENPAFPLCLNTGRIRDQWHTMTRTGRAARLSLHIAEPFIEIHHADAAEFGLETACIAEITSQQGRALARVQVTDRARRGSVFMPMHFTDSFASLARVDALVHSLVDPVSGQPALKSTSVAVGPFEANWFGFAALAHQVFEDVFIPDSTEYWAKARTEAGLRIELAATQTPDDLTDYLFKLLGQRCDDIIGLTGSDGTERVVAVHDGKVVALIYAAADPVAVSRDWVCEQLGQAVEGHARARLLAGRPGADMPDRGAIICSCEGVGANEIRAAVAQGCETVAAIGECTRAGTNCGSCRAELREFLKVEVRDAAE